MEKFEAFIKVLLKLVFRQTPFDKEKANASFEKIKEAQSKQTYLSK